MTNGALSSIVNRQSNQAESSGLLDTNAMAPSLRVTLFGPLRVERDGRALADRAWRSRQERRLLGALVAARGATIPLSRLTEWLWPGIDQDSAAVTLRSAISSLRQTLSLTKAERLFRYRTLEITVPMRNLLMLQ